MNTPFYIFASIAIIAAAGYERILTGSANPILVFGAIASVFYIGIELHNFYFCKKKKR
jgi:hypothetical protein